MMNIQQIKALSVDRLLDIDEAVLVSAEIRFLEAEYDFLEIATPDWLTKVGDLVREEIARRTRSATLAELQRLESEVESYKSAAERRTAAQSRIGQLQAKLGLSKAKR